MILAHKITLDPTMKQRKLFSMAAGCSRVAYNWGLMWWKQEYVAGNRPTALKAKKAFNQVKHQLFPWMALSPKDANQNAFEDLGDAFKKFFCKKSRYPRFKRLKDKRSFYVSNDRLRVEGNKISLPKIGWVKMFEPLRFVGKIMSATVSNRADRWFVSIHVDVSSSQVAKTKQLVAGVDIGLKQAVVVSDGTSYNAPKPLKENLRKLQRWQRVLSRRKKGSNRRQVACSRVAKLHARIADVRKDFIHKVTTDLGRRFTTICIEDLHVKGMLKNHKLARAISDIGFGEFRRQLEYKSKLLGFYLVVVNRWFPSTQTCSRCGCIKEGEKKLGLGDREYICEDCGLRIDRDLNAAINLSTAGSAGSHARGHHVSPHCSSGEAKVVESRTKPRKSLHSSTS